MRPPLVCKAFCTILKETLDDFMLKVLLVCAAFSIIFDMSLAEDADERSHGKQSILLCSLARSARPFCTLAPDRRIKLIIIV